MPAPTRASGGPPRHCDRERSAAGSNPGAATPRHAGLGAASWGPWIAFVARAPRNDGGAVDDGWRPSIAPPPQPTRAADRAPSISVLPSDQTGPTGLWLSAITASNEFSI